MTRQLILSLLLVAAAAVGLGLLGYSALATERLRVEDTLRRAHQQAISPLLEDVSQLFVEAQASFVASLGSEPINLASADQINKVREDELVAYAYAIEHGRLIGDHVPGETASFLANRKKLNVMVQNDQQERAQQKYEEQSEKQVQQLMEQTGWNRRGQSAAQGGQSQERNQGQRASQQEDTPQQRRLRSQQIAGMAQGANPSNTAVFNNDTQGQTVELVTLGDLVGDSRARFIPIFDRNELQVLYWRSLPPRPRQNKGKVQLAEGGPSGVGFALDMGAVRRRLAELMKGLPPQADLVTAIRDHNGTLLAASGPVADGEAAFVELPLHPRLPHWRLVAYARSEALESLVSARRFMLAALLAGCGVALLFGLVLLVAELRRESALVARQADFVSNVSHELKTPLTSIRMYAELLLRRFGDQPKAVEYAGVILDESDRLGRHVARILDFSRGSRGLRTYQRRSTELAGLISDSVAYHRQRFEPQGVELSWTPPAADVSHRASVDSEAIGQVLTNLLSNAQKYGGSDEQPARIEVALARQGDRALITVRDHGPGVPARWRRRIFEPFIRGDSSLAAQTQGSGIGLALAQDVALAHDGALSVRDAEGGGAIFELSLPLEESSS